MVTFKYQKESSDLFGTIYRPVAEVLFKDSNGNQLVSFMYVDSGADITLIPRKMGENLGLKFDEKDIREVRGVGDSKVPIVVKKVDIQIGDEVFETRIAWALEEGVPPLLGRIDVFDKFEVRFKQKEKVTVFEVEE